MCLNLNNNNNIKLLTKCQKKTLKRANIIWQMSPFKELNFSKTTPPQQRTKNLKQLQQRLQHNKQQQQQQ